MFLSKKKNVIGLDIGCSSIKLVELKRIRTGLSYKIWQSLFYHPKRSLTEH